jgi:hypothetical protein
MIDWSNVTPPAFVSDTHVVTFFLNSPDSPPVGYQGYLFYKPGSYAGNPEIYSHFFGTGYLSGTPGYCNKHGLFVPPWVRISIEINFNGLAYAGVNFFSDTGGRPDGPPLGQSFEAEVTMNPAIPQVSLGNWSLQLVESTLTP